MRFVKITVPFLSILLLSTSCISRLQQPANSPYQIPLTVGEKKIFVEIVETTEAKKQGLSGREKLKGNEGMLFDFRKDPNKKPPFWMKDMNFDIDIIWIKNNRIIEITHGATAPKNSFERLKIYSPPGKIDFVLEMNEGWSELNSVNIGDKIGFD